jgi:peptidoglycan/xylan/chitin deacetylase (PgdA/CDA1 family)
MMKAGPPRNLRRCLGFAVILAASAPPVRSFGASGSDASLPVIVYHQIRVAPDGPPDGMTVISYERFAGEMKVLHDQGYATLGMNEVVRFLKGEKFPPRSVAIQFDDGWRSALSARPVLDKYGFKATFWAITGSVGSGALFMDWPTLRRLDKSPNFKVFSHTMTHPYAAGDTFVDWLEGRTAGKSAVDVRRELTESKRVLEKKLAHPVPYLDWPAGVFNDALVDMARKAGYTALVTTVDGVNLPGGDPLRIHRTLINGACDEQAFLAILADGRYRACASPAK